MHVDVYKTRRDWQFRVEHMGREITGWSLDEQGARHAAEKSRAFLKTLATEGIELTVTQPIYQDACPCSTPGKRIYRMNKA